MTDTVCLYLKRLYSSSPLMGEDRGEGEAIKRLTSAPLTLTLSHQGRGNRNRQTRDSCAPIGGAT